MLAIEKGELDGIVGYSWGVARVGNKDDIAAGRLKVVMQLGTARHKDLPDVPMLQDFVSNPEDRQVLDMIFSRQAMGRPLVAPPGLDPRVAQALRQGVADAMRHASSPSAKMNLGVNSSAAMQCKAGRAALPIRAQRDRAPGDRGGGLAWIGRSHSGPDREQNRPRDDPGSRLTGAESENLSSSVAPSRRLPLAVLPHRVSAAERVSAPTRTDRRCWCRGCAAWCSGGRVVAGEDFRITLGGSA